MARNLQFSFLFDSNFWKFVILFLFYVGGIVMIVLGPFYLLDKNTYYERVEKFNAENNHFRSEIGSQIKNWTSTTVQYNSHTYSMEIVNEPLQTFGKFTTLNQTFSTSINKIVSPYVSGVSVTISIPKINIVSKINIADPSTDSEKLWCTSLRCSTYDNKKSNLCYCSLSDMQQACRSKHPGGTFNTHSTILTRCSNNDALWCGTCKWKNYQTSACIVLENNGGIWNVSNSVVGCEYPFNSQTTSEILPTSFSFSVRSISDPYIVAGNLTKGTFDFGMTPDQQRKTGIVLTVFGTVLLLMAFVCTPHKKIKNLCSDLCGYDNMEVTSTPPIKTTVPTIYIVSNNNSQKLPYSAPVTDSNLPNMPQ